MSEPVDLPGQIYQVIPGFEDHLEAELAALAIHTPPPERYGPSLYHVVLPGDTDKAVIAPVFWFRNVWLKPFRLEFDSLSSAVGVLRSIQRNWAAAPFTCFRRAALIIEKLPPLPQKPKPFPWQVPAVPMGAWTLLDEHTMIASAVCGSPFPGGILEFEEDKSGPPSRAYLKLWEALTLIPALGRDGLQGAAGQSDSGKEAATHPCRSSCSATGDFFWAALHGSLFPVPGSRCLDAGASPGGWTWALRQLGAEVIAVDRSPLEERIAALPGVRYLKHDAFTLKPGDVGPLDWLFCDAAVYPPRLYRWIEDWLASGLCSNFVCTIKMQGIFAGNNFDVSDRNTLDFDTPRRFAALPGSRVVHLYHNKHELCWIRTG